jgi:hypothetical protein
MLAWQRAVVLGDESFAPALRRATEWLLAARGEPLPRTAEMGHDCTLVGWSWVAGTHSWIEPTAWSVLALKAVGHGQHRRTREALRLLEDRLLPDGGCNYGNTTVLGQPLRPHVQPTGLTLLALEGEAETRRLRASLDYLRSALSATTTSASLSYGLLGLAAHQALPAAANDWLAAAAHRLPPTAPSPGTPGEGWGEGHPRGPQAPHPNPLPGVPGRGGFSVSGLKLALLLLAASTVEEGTK